MLVCEVSEKVIVSSISGSGSTELDSMETKQAITGQYCIKTMPGIPRHRQQNENNLSVD